MRKITVCLLVFVLAVSLISCSDGGETVFNGSIEDLPEYGFDGMEIMFTSDNDYNNVENSIFGYRYDTPLYDSMLVRINSIQKKYNCVIKNSSYGSLPTLLPVIMLSQVSMGDAFFLDAAQFRSVAGAGCMLDLAAYSDIIDVTDAFRWGEKNVLEILCCNGHLYGVTPASWIDNLPPFYYVLVSNNEVLEKNSFGDPREYYENGKWNRDLFEEMIRECSDLETGMYGLDTSTEFVMRMAVYSNGIGLLDSSSQSPRSAWHDPRFAGCLEWGYGFCRRNSDIITGGGGSCNAFIEGKSAVAMSAVYNLVKKIVFSESVKEFSIVPFPCGDDCEPGTGCGFFSTGIATVSIPVYSTSETETATVISELFAPMDGYDTREKLDEYYTSSIFFDPMDIRIIHELAGRTEYNYWVEDVNKPFEDLISIVLSGKQTPSQAIDARIDDLDRRLLEYVIPNREGLETYFSGNN